MKKLILCIALIWGISPADAQKLKNADVPAAVNSAFIKLYPSVKPEKWEKENGNYEAEFDLGKVETSVLLDASGNLLETETEIAVSDLPKAVSEYVAKNMAGKKIKEASKIVDSKGVVTFEAEVNEVDYIFDESGNFIRKEVENDTDKD